MGGLELGRFQDGLSSLHHQVERCDRVYRVCLCRRHRTRRILALEWVFLIPGGPDRSTAGLFRGPTTRRAVIAARGFNYGRSTNPGEPS
jgi:hypothetical protein